MSIRTPLIAFCLLASAAGLAAQHGIRLVQVPERLVLPAAAGTNLTLEVEVTGAPRLVWLGAEGVTARVELTAAGAGRWQCNLGDPAVDKIVRAVQVDTLRVFAEGSGPVASSAAIAFQRAEARPAELRCTAHLVHTAEPAAVAWATTNWLAPAAVQHLDVEGVAADTVLVAHFGATDCPLVRRGDRGAWRLELDEQKRAAWQQAGRLEIVSQRGSEVRPAFLLEAVPATLELTADNRQFSIAQRRSDVVPGSRGYLRVRIADVTGGQTLLEVRTADGHTPVHRRSVHARDHVAIELAGGRYELVVRRLVNFLIGDDFAEFEIVPAAAFQTDPIGQLLDSIAAADLTFVREGRDYSGAEAAAHLRAKLDFITREVALDEFIEQIASKSSATGSDYTVRMQDGKVTPMREWLRAELGRIEAAAKARQPSGH